MTDNIITLPPGGRPPDPRALFRDSVPSGFLEESIRIVDRAYRHAYELCSEHFAEPEAHDILGDMRRGMIEQGWRTAAKAFEGVDATVSKNAGDNCNHTEVTAGRVVLTESCVRWPTEVVRRAIFRDGLARSNQLVLFPDLWPAPDPDASLFAIVLHGSHPDYPDRVAFLEVAFPDPSGGYLDHFDLLDWFPHLEKEVLPDISARIIGEPRPHLRKPRRTGVVDDE